MQDTHTTQAGTHVHQADNTFTLEELEALSVQAEALARNTGMTRAKAERMVLKSARSARATEALEDAPMDPAAKMLRAIGATMSHVYAGSVPAEEIIRRRNKNKRARQARRAARRG